MSAFHIIMVNEQPFWHPGDWLEGIVMLTWRSRRQVRGVRLKLSGGEHTQWTESYTTHDSKGHSHTHHRTLSSTEHVLDTAFTFWGFPRGSRNETSLDPGLYIWPFRIALPHTIAHASVEHHLGHVRYALSAYIDVPWSSDIVFSKPLHVIPRMPLSARPDLLVPMSAVQQKKMTRFCCFANGTIEATVTCGKRGVVPGDQIPVTVRLENNSGEAISGITLTFSEFLDFYASGKHRSDERQVAVLVYNQRVEAHAGAHEVPLTLSIPAGLPNPNFDGRYIKRSHFLTVRVKIDASFTFDMRLKFPVVGCSTSTDSGVPPDIAPSIFNPEGLPRQKFYPATGQATSVAPVCLEALDYNPVDQVDFQNCVRYPTFYSANFTLPETLRQYNPALYQHILPMFAVYKSQ